MQSYYQVLQDYLDQGVPCVSVTQVHTVGSAPQNVGAKMIVGTHDRLWGTIGGGKIENHCIIHAKTLLQQQQSHDYQVWNLQTDIGMTCGGVSHFFFEVHRNSPWTIAVFGAGHVAQALIPILCTLPCQVLCFDNRTEWVERLSPHPQLTAHTPAVLADSVKTLPHHAFVLSVTMGHAHDVPVIDALLRERHTDAEAFPYIGVIGSKAKAGAIRRDLKKRGHSEEALSTLICPVGLSLGSNLPAEIAISITAQLLQYRDQRLR